MFCLFGIMAADAKRYESELIQGLVESRSRLVDMVTARLAAATKDNESVYHYVGFFLKLVLLYLTLSYRIVS